MASSKMNDHGWWNYIDAPPHPGLLLQFRRAGSTDTFLAYGREFLPSFNVGNLEWRLTGIAKYQLDVKCSKGFLERIW